MLPPYPPSPTIPGAATQQVSIAPTAASTALPPRSRIVRPAAAAAGWGVATAVVGRLDDECMVDAFEDFGPLVGLGTVPG